MTKISQVIAAACIVTAAAITTATAAPSVSDSYGPNYLVTSDKDLGAWHIGIDYRYLDLQADYNGQKINIPQADTIAYVGHDITSWIGGYVGAGYRSSSTKDTGPDADGGIALTAGAWFNFLDQELLDSYLLVQRIRVRSSLAYTYASTSIGSDDINQSEIYGNLLFEVVNETWSNKNFAPIEISIFGGVVLDALWAGDIEPENDFLGATIGMSTSFGARSNAALAYEIFSDDVDAITASFNLRF